MSTQEANLTMQKYSYHKSLSYHICDTKSLCSCHFFDTDDKFAHQHLQRNLYSRQSIPESNVFI